MSSPSSFPVVGLLRQNPWGKLCDNALTFVDRWRKVHCPHGHTQHDVEAYEADPSAFNKNYAQHFPRFPTGSLLIIAEAKKDEALLVRLVSDTQTGIFDPFILVRRAVRSCGHPMTSPDCADCKDSVVQIHGRYDVSKHQLLDHMLDGCVAEPFHTLFRDVEIVGRVRLTGDDAAAVRHYVCSCQASLKKTGIDVPAALIIEEPYVLL